MSEDLKPPKKMSPKEFWQLGYLQELNRQFLHPLGLALEIIIDDHTDNNGQAVQDVSFGQVWDYRDDPEGMEFWLDNGDGGLDIKAMRAKAQRIADEQADKARTRMERLGYVIQDLVTPQELAETRQAMGTTPNQEER